MFRPSAALLLALTLGPAGFTAELDGADYDAAEIMRRAFDRSEELYENLLRYTYVERVEERDFDSSGRVSETRSKTWDMQPLFGAQHARLIGRDGKPLSPEVEAKEQRKLDRLTEERAKETSAQRERRLAKEREDGDEMRRIIAEAKKAYGYRVVGEETMRGHEAWVIEATPRASYQPAFWKASFLKGVRGKVWIAKRDDGWLKAEAESIDTLSVAWFLFRLDKGATLAFEQSPLDDGAWMLDWFELRFKARLALVKGYNRLMRADYRDYRRYDAASPEKPEAE